MSASDEIKKLTQAIATYLCQKGATIATAESCTGGKVASLFTSLPGASEWYKGGVVAYTREAKMVVLGVPEEELSDGLVTARCAKAMATMAAQKLHSQYAIATTGVCGPSSSEGVDPNTAWVAVYSRGNCHAQLAQLPDNGREHNIESMALSALRIFMQQIQEVDK